EQEIGGAAHTDQPRQQPRARRLRHEPTLHEDERDARALARQSDVPLQRQRGADTGDRAVERRDDGLSHLPRLERQPFDLLLLAGARLVEHRAAALQIGTDAEVASGTRDDDGAHVVALVRLLQGVAQLDAHAPGPRVAPLGTIQRDGGHLPGDLEADLLVVHPCLPQCGSVSCSRTTPTTTAAMPASRTASRLSPSATIPTSAVNTAPSPVHTA